MDIVDRLRSTTEAMASHASVDMALWDRHSNACLEAAAEITGLRKERDEARAALRPFAEWVPVPLHGPDDGVLHGEDDTEISEFVLHYNPPTFGHLRAARAALPKPPETT
jgi:L-alanine-DL-glutamate epimerase-like enolase superfamily enzyme